MTGVFLKSTGKGVAFVAGSSVILLEIAHYKGYIKHDIRSLRAIAEKKTEEVGNKLANSTKNATAVRVVKTKSILSCWLLTDLVSDKNVCSKKQSIYCRISWRLSSWCSILEFLNCNFYYFLPIFKVKFTTKF